MLNAPRKVCSVEGCERAANVNGAARGWCPKHYQAWRAHGDPLGGAPPRRSEERESEIVAESVKIGPECECDRPVRAIENDTPYCFTCGKRLPDESDARNGRRKLSRVQLEEQCRRLIRENREMRAERQRGDAERVEHSEQLRATTEELRTVRSDLAKSKPRPGEQPSEILAGAVAGAVEGRPAGRAATLRDFAVPVESEAELDRHARSGSQPDPLSQLHQQNAAILAELAELRDAPEASAPVPRITLTREEAARALGVGLTTFKTKIAPHLPVVREGKIRLYRVAELERWAEENGERVLGP